MTKSPTIPAAAPAAAIALIVLARPSAAQTTPSAPPPQPAATETLATPWSFSAFAYVYFPPASSVYVNPNLTADHGWLHLEARYNYEALRTGSAWVGYNFKVGKKLAFAVTPMVGAVLGDDTGVALGANLSLGYGPFELSSQSEYVFNAEDRSEDFFYIWSELSVSPAEWFRAGIAVQRTKVYQTDLAIQRGPFLGFAYKGLNATVYVFNVGWTDPTVVLSAGADF